MPIWEGENDLFLDFEESLFHHRKSSFDECEKNGKKFEIDASVFFGKTPSAIFFDERIFDDEVKDMGIYDEIEKNLMNKIAKNTLEVLY